MAGAWDASDEDIWNVYKKNLLSVIPHIEDLFDSLKRKSVVTSDQDNMIGERAKPIPIHEYGHPRWIYAKELVNVPWLIYDSGVRKTVTEELGSPDEQNDENVNINVKALGYK